MEEDILTQQHAQIIAYDYNICPRPDQKTERVIGAEDDVCSLWLATHDGNIRCFVQYHADELEKL